MWECKETFSDELLGSWLPQNAKYYTRGWYRKERIDKTHLCTKASNPILRIHTWWNLVNDYRSRSLSNASDRIMAITGVAKAFQEIQGLTYLAGLWKESLAYDLCWSLSESRSHRDHSAVTQDVETTSTPSWSWFSHTFFKPDNVQLRPLHFITFGTSIYSAELLRFQWADQPPNLLTQAYLYDFTGLQLSVKLPTLRATLQNQDLTAAERNHLKNGSTFHSADGQSLCYTEFEEHVTTVCSDLGPPGSTTGHLGFEYRCDDLEHVESLPCSTFLALLVEELSSPSQSRSRWSGQTTEIYQMTGLGLEPAGKNGTWKRVGSWRALVERHSDILDNSSLTGTQSTVHEGRKSLVILIHVNASTNNRQNEELASERSKKRRFPCFCDSRA